MIDDGGGDARGKRWTKHTNPHWSPNNSSTRAGGALQLQTERCRCGTGAVSPGTTPCPTSVTCTPENWPSAVNRLRVRHILPPRPQRRPQQTTPHHSRPTHQTAHDIHHAASQAQRQRQAAHHAVSTTIVSSSRSAIPEPLRGRVIIQRIIGHRIGAD